MPHPTPGQVAYDAWRTRYDQGRAQRAVPWDVCSSDYRASGVPEALTAPLDRIIDACCSVMLQQAAANDHQGRCPMCGAPLDNNAEDPCAP